MVLECGKGAVVGKAGRLKFAVIVIVVWGELFQGTATFYFIDLKMESDVTHPTFDGEPQ